MRQHQTMRSSMSLPLRFFVLAGCVCLLAANPRARADVIGLEIALDHFALSGLTPLRDLPGYDGQTVFNIYALFDDPADQCLGVVGTPANPFSIQIVSGSGFFNVPPSQGGADTPPTAFFATLVPQLNWDSFYTLGVKLQDDFSTDLIIVPGTPGPGVAPWPPNPSTSMGWSLPASLPGGEPTPETLAGPALRVQIMRLSGTFAFDDVFSDSCSLGLVWRDAQTGQVHETAVGFLPICCLDCYPQDPPDCVDRELEACEVLLGWEADCNFNLISDDCEDSFSFDASSGTLSPFGTGIPRSIVVPGYWALGDVSLHFTAQADLDDPSEWISVDINGMFLGTVLQMGTDCTSTLDTQTLIIPAGVFNQAAAGGPAFLTMTASPDVDPLCDGLGTSFVTVEVEYFATNDLDGNDVPDDCGCDADVAQPPDGVVNVNDLIAVILSWGQPGGPADVNGDAVIDVDDLVLVILAWGPCD